MFFENRFKNLIDGVYVGITNFVLIVQEYFNACNGARPSPAICCKQSG